MDDEHFLVTRDAMRVHAKRFALVGEFSYHSCPSRCLLLVMDPLKHLSAGSF
jgi:hypothetical protein